MEAHPTGKGPRNTTPVQEQRFLAWRRADFDCMYSSPGSFLPLTITCLVGFRLHKYNMKEFMKNSKSTVAFALLQDLDGKS